MKGIIYNIDKYMTENGPGFRTVVYMKGCNLHCTSCETPQAQLFGQEMGFIKDKCEKCYKCAKACNERFLAEEEHRMFHCTLCGNCVKACQKGARSIIGRYIEPEELVDEIMPEIEFYQESGGGITFSGGEPMMQEEFLLETVQLLKERDVNIAIKMTGTLDYEIYEKFIPYVDNFIWDLRTVSSNKYKTITGLSNGKMIENLKKISYSPANVYIKITLIREINCNKEELSKFIRFIHNFEIAGVYLKPYDSKCEENYELIGKQRKYKLNGPNEKTLKVIEQIFKKANDNVSIIQ